MKMQSTAKRNGHHVAFKPSRTAFDSLWTCRKCGVSHAHLHGFEYHPCRLVAANETPLPKTPNSERSPA